MLEIIGHYIKSYGVDPDLRDKLSVAAPELLMAPVEPSANHLTTPDWTTFIPHPPQASVEHDLFGLLDERGPVQTQSVMENQQLDYNAQSATSLAELPFYPSGFETDFFSDEQFDTILRESQDNGLFTWEPETFDGTLINDPLPGMLVTRT